MTAINPDALLEREATSMGRPATLLGHTVTFQEGGKQIVQTLVYDLEGLESRHSQRLMYERRWAVYIDDVATASGIIATWWEEQT